MLELKCGSRDDVVVQLAGRQATMGAWAMWRHSRQTIVHEEPLSWRGTQPSQTRQPAQGVME